MGLRPDRRADITALISGSYGNFKSSCFHPAEHLPRFALPAHQRIDASDSGRVHSIRPLARKDQRCSELISDISDLFEYYQFFRGVIVEGAPRNLKFDFLAAPVLGEQAKKVKADVRCIRQRAVTGAPMHAHTTPEALTGEENLLAVNIGEADKRIEVFLPHLFSYAMLKLFALRDQIDNEAKEFGRHHAFDIYSTWAMMTEEGVWKSGRAPATVRGYWGDAGGNRNRRCSFRRRKCERHDSTQRACST